MEASKKKPAAKPAPAAKMPAPKLSSGKYTFSKAECLRRYLLKKSSKSGKGISPAKKAEVSVFTATFVTIDVLQFLTSFQYFRGRLKLVMLKNLSTRRPGLSP